MGSAASDFVDRPVEIATTTAANTAIGRTHDAEDDHREGQSVGAERVAGGLLMSGF
ncbi:hypothetical protein RISK_003842 [Rhodopirellula islandica]|uniref:Uncharacterized protein n=1 Tax=Rhodopirellula islandica TaxID=595434 RepID=A0A0J1BCM7_RHOIS|nr:hypothetical protein RISK_003842 [Rhodopirellula islandica]